MGFCRNSSRLSHGLDLPGTFEETHLMNQGFDIMKGLGGIRSRSCLLTHMTHPVTDLMINLSVASEANIDGSLIS